MDHERKKRVLELLDAVGLSDRAGHKPDELSGGQRQRVAIAAALANDPEVLLCDEPTGDLDTETGEQVVRYLHMVNKEFGKTVLIVTHDPSVARQCDRIYRIQDGRIRSVQTPNAEGTGRDSAVSRVDFVRERIRELTAEMHRLDGQVMDGSISPEDFALRRTELMQRKRLFEEELHRLGL